MPREANTPWIVSQALRRDRSTRYQALKGFFRNILNNPDYPYKKYFDLFMIALILSSVWILVHEVKHPLPHWVDIYDLYVVTVIFIIEYLLRLWVYSDLHRMVLKEYDEALLLNRPIRYRRIIKPFILSKIRYMLTQPLDFDPGTQYAYSNFGYCVLGRIIEKIAGAVIRALKQS